VEEKGKKKDTITDDRLWQNYGDNLVKAEILINDIIRSDNMKDQPSI
jgi:hypothetical protein